MRVRWYVWLWVALGAIRLTWTLWTVDVSATDFRTFHFAAGHLGEPDPQWRVSLNPPTFTLSIVPIAWVPLVGAFWLWMALGAWSLIATLRLLARHGASRVAVLVTIGALGATTPAIDQWRQGQVVWLLLYPLTRAWLSPSPIAAGAWLSPLLIWKPAFVPVLLVMPWTTSLTAGSLTVLAALVTLALGGLDLWIDWLAMSDRIVWLSWVANASFVGQAARLQTFDLWGVRPSDLAWPWLLAVAALAALWVWQSRRLPHDARWLSALWGAVLFQPLGWIAYAVLALGPAIARWPRDPRVSVLLLAAATLPLSTLIGPAQVADGLALTIAGSYWCLLLTLATRHGTQVAADPTQGDHRASRSRCSCSTANRSRSSVWRSQRIDRSS